MLKYHLLFSLTWIFSLMFYPIWIEPAPPETRAIIYIVTAAWTLLNIIFFYRFLSNTDLQPFHEKPSTMKPDIFFVTLLMLLFINILLHIYPISFPLMISDDEAAHASGGIGLITRFLWMKGLDPGDYFVYIRTGVWALIATALSLYFFRPARTYLNRIFFTRITNSYILLFVILFAISLIFFLLTRNMEYFLMLMRYPPIGKILYALSLSLLGINEYAIRIPQMLFAVFTAFIIYRICSDSLDSRETGLLAACCYVFSPMVFYYSSLGELISGTVFFSVVVIYFYLKYVKTDITEYLLMSFYMVSFGFLYKRVIVVMLGALITGLLLLKVNRRRLPLIIKLSYFSLVPILPYLVLGKMYPNNPFGLNFSNWLSPGPAFGYLAVLAKQLSYPLYALAILSTISIFFRKDIFKPAVFISFISFLLYYLLYTSSSLNTELYPLLYAKHEAGAFIVGTERYSMVFFPFISIITGVFLYRISAMIRWKHSFKLIFSLLTLYLVLLCTVWQVPPLNAQFVKYKNIKSHYFPVNEAMEWVRDNIRDGETMLILRVAPATFYRDRYRIDREKIVDIWYDLKKVSTPGKLKSLMAKRNISYIMFSYNNSEREKILMYLKNYRGAEYSRFAEFSSGGNYIYIYRTEY